MAIIYVGTGSGAGSIFFWAGTSPQSASSYTPAVNNTLLAVVSDRSGITQTPILTSSVGSYTKLATTGQASNATTSAFSSIGVPNTAQVLTADSSPTGDYVEGIGWEFSGVGAVTATVTNASSSSTAVGAISGSAVIVPSGSVLFVLFLDVTESIGSNPVLDTGSQVYVDSFHSLGVTYTGTGASITPAATPAGATATNYAVVQFLLSPATTTLSPAPIDYAISLQSVSLITQLPAATISYGINLQPVTLTAPVFAATLFANALAYDITLAPSRADFSVPSAALSYQITLQNATLGPLLIPVPSVLGLSIAVASTQLIADGFVPSVGSGVYSSLYALGLVATQSPVGGSFAPAGATITLQPSLGVAPIGALTIAQAIQAIIQAGLVPVVLYTPSATVPAGSIIPGSQSPPAGTLVIPGSQQALVSFVVSAGPPQLIGNVTMPNCVGLFVQNAYQALQAVNLSVDRLTWVVSNFQEATVTAQSVPAGNSVKSGTIIKLTVSLGPAAPSKAVATPTVS